MPAAIISVRRAEDVRDVIHQAVQALVEGQLVAFPTETVYGIAASALHEDAVARLVQLKSREEGKPLALAVKSADEAMDYVPNSGWMGKRLARRCWPGPITLVLPDNHPESLIRQLPQSTVKHVVHNGFIGLRVPAHDVVLEVLRLLAGPIVLTSANYAGQPEAISADTVNSELGEGIDLILDDGPCRFAQASSVVRVDHDGYELLREGVVSAENVKRLASVLIVMVCTGNTCRSPMAELLCRKQLANRLGCEVDALEKHGFIVMSGGIAAMAGGRPSAEAVEVMADRQLDLRDHEAQPLNRRMIQHADLILTMTHGHRAAILRQWPEAAERTQLLSTSDQDISDPIGAPRAVYDRCAEQIDAELANRVNSDDFARRVGWSNET